MAERVPHAHLDLVVHARIGPRLWSELGEAQRVGDGDYGVRPVAQQQVAPLALRRVDGTGHDGDLASELDRVVGGDERAAVERRLDDDRERRNGGENPIPIRERSLVRMRARRKLRHHQSASDDLAVQRDVRTWIGNVGACAEDGDRRAARLQRGMMRRGVDPECHSADDARAGARERGRELARDSFAVSCRAPRADDRDERLVEQTQIADPPEPRRWVRQIVQRGRIRRVISRDAFDDHGFTGAERRRGERRPSFSSRAAASTRRRAADRVRLVRRR